MSLSMLLLVVFLAIVVLGDLFSVARTLRGVSIDFFMLSPSIWLLICSSLLSLCAESLYLPSNLLVIVN